MSEINRSLMVVKPKQPYLDWARSVFVDEGFQLDDIRDDTSAYLIPEFEFLTDRMEILSWCLDFVFEEELYAWCTDRTTWPNQRDLNTFLQWFDVEFHSIVSDLTPDVPLEHLDYGDDEGEQDKPVSDEPSQL
jgi:hypothetical protein